MSAITGVVDKTQNLMATSGGLIKERSGTPAKAMSQVQQELENNAALQSVLHTRKMMQDSLRQAMIINSSSSAAKGGKRVAGATCFAWGAGCGGAL